jgi:anti-anti-sigma factor
MVRVRVEGELDLADAPGLEELLKHEISAGNEVVLDLCDLTFMDCAGLHAILAAADEAHCNGGELKMTGSLRAQVRRLIELAHVQDAFDSIPD